MSRWDWRVSHLRRSNDLAWIFLIQAGVLWFSDVGIPSTCCSTHLSHLHISGPAWQQGVTWTLYSSPNVGLKHCFDSHHVEAPCPSICWRPGYHQREVGTGSSESQKIIKWGHSSNWQIGFLTFLTLSHRQYIVFFFFWNISYYVFRSINFHNSSHHIEERILVLDLI